MGAEVTINDARFRAWVRAFADDEDDMDTAFGRARLSLDMDDIARTRADAVRRIVDSASRARVFDIPTAVPATVHCYDVGGDDVLVTLRATPSQFTVTPQVAGFAERARDMTCGGAARRGLPCCATSSTRAPGRRRPWWTAWMRWWPSRRLAVPWQSSHGSPWWTGPR